MQRHCRDYDPTTIYTLLLSIRSVRVLFVFARLLRVGGSVWGGECTNRGRSSVHLLARALNSMGSASEHYGAVTHPHSASHPLGAPLLPPFISSDLCQIRPFTPPLFECGDREL